MSKSIQVKSLLSHSQYSPLGAKLSPVNDSFCSVCATEERRRDCIGSCLQSVARFDWCAALLAWHRLRSGSYQITIYTLSSNARVKSLSQQQVPWGYHARTHKQWRNVGKEEGGRSWECKIVTLYLQRQSTEAFERKWNLSYLQRQKKKKRKKTEKVNTFISFVHVTRRQVGMGSFSSCSESDWMSIFGNVGAPRWPVFNNTVPGLSWLGPWV